MEIGRIQGTTRVIGRSQGYYGLPVKDVLLNDTVLGTAHPPVMVAVGEIPF